MSGPLVIGIGNALRGDDAIGLRVAAALRGRAGDNLRVHESNGDLTQLLDDFASTQDLVLVDAIVSGREAGEVCSFDLSRDPLPVEAQPNSSHVFSLAQVVEMARTLGRLPARVHLVGIEIGSVRTGAPMGEAIESAVDVAVERVHAHLRADPKDPTHA